MNFSNALDLHKNYFWQNFYTKIYYTKKGNYGIVELLISMNVWEFMKVMKGFAKRNNRSLGNFWLLKYFYGEGQP